MRRPSPLDVGVVLSSILLLNASTAWAQNTRGQSTVPTAQQLNPAELAPPPTRARSNDIFAAPEPGPCPLRDSTLSFTLKHVELTGAQGMRENDLSDAYRGLVGQSIPVASICDIRDRAAAILFSKGILARVEIPQQTIADGQLRLEVIEARIANIHFHGDAGPAQAKVEAYLEKLRGLTPFDLNVAQRYLLLAADVPGVQISAAIRPSVQGRGAVDLDVSISRRMIDVAVNVENFGSRSLGPWAGLGRVDFKGLTAYGDRTALVVYSTLDGREQRIVQLIQEIRPTDTGLILRGSASYALTHPGGDLAPFNLEGNALDVELTATYPLIRRQHDNLNLIGGLAIVNQNTDFASGGALIDDKLRIFYLCAEANLHNNLFGKPFEGALGLEVRQGLNGLGASHISDVALSRATGVPDATVERLDGHASLAFTNWFQFYVGGQYQYAHVPLLSYEQLAIGNLTIGRGYDPSSVAGDRGGAAAFEARFGPVLLPLSVKASTYGFYDVGSTEFVDTHESITVRSAGAGFRFSIPSGLDVDVFYAAPFDKVSPSAASKPPSRIMFALTYRN